MAFLEFMFIFIIGSIGYGSLEMLWRGRTHWTMLMLGGICLYLIYLIANRMKDSIIKKAILCTAVVTTLEFVAGCLINMRLGWDVWDYSSMPFNLMGQICPTFSLMWMLISFPCIFVCRLIYKLIFAPNFNKK